MDIDEKSLRYYAIAEGHVAGVPGQRSSVRCDGEPWHGPPASTACPQGALGPLTNAILLSHLMQAARDQAEGRRALGAGSATYTTTETAR
jgi:hypothetical protein